MEKLKSEKTPEDALAFAKETGRELTDAKLESIAGGFDYGWFCVTANSHPEVIPPKTVFE